MAIPSPEKLSKVSLSRNLDLFKTTNRILRTRKAIERIWARQMLMPWLRAVITSWLYEQSKRHLSKNTQAYQSYQLNIGTGAYKRVFLTHKKAVTTAVKRVAGMFCTTQSAKMEVL